MSTHVRSGRTARPLKKMTILVPNRGYTSSSDAKLPTVSVSVSRPPWVGVKKPPTISVDVDAAIDDALAAWF